jgi:hypothetical protein
MLTDSFKADLQNQVEQQISGLSTGANVNVSKSVSQVMTLLTSDTTLRNIQKQALSASQSININLQVGGNARLGSLDASQAIDQIVSAQASQINQIIKQNTSETSDKSSTTQKVDGLFSGSTILYAIYAIVIAGVITVVIKMALSKPSNPSNPSNAFIQPDFSYAPLYDPSLPLPMYQ